MSKSRPLSNCVILLLSPCTGALETPSALFERSQFVLTASKFSSWCPIDLAIPSARLRHSWRLCLGGVRRLHRPTERLDRLNLGTGLNRSRPYFGIFQRQPFVLVCCS